MGRWCVKIGMMESLDKEFKNYSKYVKQGPLPAEYKVDLHDPKFHGDKAILPIDFVNNENYRVFTDYYKENPIAALHTLLNRALKPWHERAKPKHDNLKHYIFSRMIYHRDNLIEECERLFPNFGKTCECSVLQLRRILSNPVFLLQKEKMTLKTGDEFWTIESIIHGDLNFNNIFIADENQIKLIDYENTREDIVFDDLARLECEIKFIYLKHYDIPSIWQGLMDFEALLTKELQISEDELPESAKEFENIKQAARCIAVIRNRVKEIISTSTRVKETAYWVELLIRTLKYVSYKSQDGISQLADSQKKYALISALLLTDNYLKRCDIPSEHPILPITIFPGPHLKEDELLSKHQKKDEIKAVDEQESMDLSQLKRALLAGQVILFLGPDAPKGTMAPTKLELSKSLSKKYKGSEPTIKKPDLLFSLLLKSRDIEQRVYEDIYAIYNSIDLQGFYQVLPKVRWKRIYIESVDFLAERCYEELKTESKLQNYENRFSPNESRDDENFDTVIIERPYGSARFYNDPNRKMQLSAEAIAKGKASRLKWYDLIKDVRAPLSILFYGFDWENLKELYFDIIDSVKVVDENSNFFWVSEEFKDGEGVIEAKTIGLKIIKYELNNLLEEIAYIESTKPKSELGKGITISLQNENILLDQQIVEAYAKYFEILHDGIDGTELDIGPFFKGEEINWRELAMECDVPRSQIEKIRLEKRIIDEINKNVPNKGFLLLAEYAGSGTTTIMKRIGFNILKQKICPVIYLYRLDNNSWKVVEEFYNHCGKKKFLILIDNVSPQFERFRELYGILQSRRINNVILATARKDEWNQVMMSYIQNSGEDIDTDEIGKSEVKRFKWLILQTVNDILTKEEKVELIRKLIDFGVLTKQAASKFGAGYTDEKLRYSNLLLLCWAATDHKNRKFELIVREYYNNKLKLSERTVVDIVCAVSLFYSEGITDRMLHRIVKINWDSFKLLLSSDSMQQLIIVRLDYYGEKEVNRVIPRNYGIAEILLQPDAFDFSQKILQILTENLLIKEGEQVEEDLLFNIVRSKDLHKYLNDKSNKNRLFEFANKQLPYDTRILQHWGIMLYEHAREQGKRGYLEDPAWVESTDKLNQALNNEPGNPAIFHSLGMANFVRGDLYWQKYHYNPIDKISFDLAELYFRDAIKYFKDSITSNPRDEHAYNTIAKILFNKLENLQRLGKTEEFENLMFEVHELLEECSQRVPIDKQVILEETKARWSLLRGDRTRAETQYWKLLEKNPKNHSVSYLLAAILMDENIIKSLEDAEDIIDKALAEGPRSKGFYKLKYRIAERLYPFDYPKLERLLNSLVEMNPDDPYLVFKYSVICFKNGNYPMSRQYFKISERLRFGDPSRFDMRDYIWKHTNDPDKIKQIWEEKHDQSILKVYEGNIQEYSDRKGYVIMDVSGEKLHINPIWSAKDKSFHEGQRIRFNIGFNFIGPIAINPDKV